MCAQYLERFCSFVHKTFPKLSAHGRFLRKGGGGNKLGRVYQGKVVLAGDETTGPKLSPLKPTPSDTEAKLNLGIKMCAFKRTPMLPGVGKKHYLPNKLVII